MLVRGILTAAAGLIASAAVAVPAQASISISSFSVTPSTTQAGGTLTQAGPNLSIDATFSTPDADTPDDATIALAPGLLANPSDIPVCSTSDFNVGLCPDDSQVGAGIVTGTAPEFGDLTLSLTTDAYLIQPQGDEPARIGLIVYFFDFPVATQSAPIAIRSSPNVGINLPLMGLPNNLDGVPAIIDGLHLTIWGSVDGHTFTRNPTSCAPATSSLTADSYQDSTEQTSTSSFTPTSCGSLPFSPTIAGTVSKDADDDGLGVTATITQQYDEADNQSIELTLPFSASPRLSLLASACTNSDISTCPSVGTATVTTPLLTDSLQANVVLVANPNAVPTIAIIIPPPFGITLDATPILTGSSVQALVTDVPDIPISNLTLNLPGGPNSVFVAGVHLCTDPQTFGGDFTAWSGATASPTAPATVTGCSGDPSSSSSPVTTPQSGTQPIASGPSSSPSSSTGVVRYSSGRRSRLTVVVGADRHVGRLRSVSIRLPNGLGLSAAKLGDDLSVRLDGRRVHASFSYSHGVLTVGFARTGRVAIITITSPALRFSRRDAALIRARHEHGLGLAARVDGTRGRQTIKLRPDA